MMGWLQRVFASSDAHRPPYGDEQRVREVQAVLDELAPLVALDGGRIELVGVDDDGSVVVDMRGACASCPSSAGTLHEALAPRLRAAAPWFAGLKAR